MIRIGHIDYANCTPIFFALQRQFDCTSYEFVRGVPAQLNAMLARGEIDLCPASSFAYGRNFDKFLILPDISISAIGPVKSVLLFSRYPIEDLNGRPVALTTESETSVNLVRIILGRQYGFVNHFERSSLPVGDALEKFAAILLIGDGALKASLSATGCHVYDLGDLWLQYTGLPFVFALWMVNRDAVARDGGEIRELAQRLVLAKQWAYANYDAIAIGSDERRWLSEEALVDYWRTISYDLSERHLEGVTTFFRYAAELGLLEREPAINLLDRMRETSSTIPDGSLSADNPQ